MADLISREAILEEIDKTKYHWQEYEVVRCALSHIPAVDAVEVVRCKDCRHKKNSKNVFGFGDFEQLCECVFMPEPHRVHEYCSYGKRRLKMRLIDGERLCENCKDFPQCKGEFKEECAVYVEVAAQPTIDPASVRPKGEWSTGYYVENGRYVWDCSNCCLPNDNLTDFCPNCGADMRGNPHDS